MTIWPALTITPERNTPVADKLHAQKTPSLLARGRNNGVYLVGPTGIEPMTSTV
jgi:hypothetical protein